MPVYEYECAACGHQFEEWQKINDQPVKTCPKCNEEKVERLISQTAFHLKGGGWYSDLYSSKGKGSAGGSGGSSPSEGGASGGGESSPKASGGDKATSDKPAKSDKSDKPAPAKETPKPPKADKGKASAA
jgi:putative FmdB family regulatory protein